MDFHIPMWLAFVAASLFSLCIGGAATTMFFAFLANRVKHQQQITPEMIGTAYRKAVEERFGGQE